MLHAQAQFAPLEREYVDVAARFQSAVQQRADALEQFARSGGSVDDIDAPKELRREWQRVIDGRLRNG